MDETGRDQHTLEDYVRVLWRRKVLIVLIVALTTAAVVVVSFLMTPIYESTVTLRLTDQKTSVLGGDLQAAGVSLLLSQDEINTQIEILQSRSVLEEVIARLDLVGAARLPLRLDPETRSLQVLSQLRKALTVTAVPNTQLIRISMRSSDPRQASSVANTLSDIFIARNVETKRGEAKAVLAFVTQQADLVSDRLQKAEEDLLAYRQSHGIGVLSEEARLKVDRLSAMESSYQEATVARETLDARIRALLDQMIPSSRGAGQLASAPSTPEVTAIQSRLTELQTELISLETGSASDDQKATAIKAQIDDLKSQIQQQIQRSLQSVASSSVNSALQMQLAEYQSQDVVLAAQADAWLKLIGANEQSINTLSAREIELARLERDQSINEDLYSSLMRAKNEAGIQAASQIGNIDVIDPAVPALRPVLPKKTENTIVAFVASLLIAVVLAYLVEYMDKSLKSEEEMKRLLGVPNLAVIPRFEVNHRSTGRRGRRKAAGRLTLVTRDEPNAPASESFRLLRASLRFVEVDRPLRTLMITSPTPGDGKTTIAANLSLELAALEERILIVDADFKRPAVHRIFSLPLSPGLSNILSEGIAYQDVVRRIPGVPNLDIITVGPLPPNSAELLGSARMKELIEEMKGGYNRVIFDVPPVLATTDALDLAGSLDGVLVVLWLGQTDKRAIRRTMEILRQTNVRAVGSVLNAVNTREGRYRYGGYYYSYDAKKG